MTKVYRRTSLPALDNSKSVQNPDLLNIADKNYTTTIMRYSNLALLFSQLETNDKHIVGAINELNRKVQPAKRVGETDVVGGVIIGDGIDVTEEGVISVTPATTETLGGVIVGDGLSVTEQGVLSATSGTEIKSYMFNIYPNDWDNNNEVVIAIPGVDWIPHYHILVQPQKVTSYDGYTINEYHSCGVVVSEHYQHTKLEFHATISKPKNYMKICVSYWQDDENGSIASTINSGRIADIVYTIPKNRWDSDTHIAALGDFEGKLFTGSEQIILPLPSDSSANIANNLALQAANIQDAGELIDDEYHQYYIYLYAENIPDRDLKVRILFNG